MTDQVNTTQCPFCGNANNCRAGKIEECWCVRVEIPHDLLELVPDELKNKACICQDCVKTFNENPQDFKVKYDR